MATSLESTAQAETTLRFHVRVLAVLSGIAASGSVIIPQLMPRRIEGFTTGMDALVVFLGFSFVTFSLGVFTPIYAYARANKIGVRTPAAAFAPLALFVAAVIGMILIGQIRKQTRGVEFRPAPVQPVAPPPTTQPAQ